MVAMAENALIPKKWKSRFRLCPMIHVVWKKTFTLRSRGKCRKKY